MKSFELKLVNQQAALFAVKNWHYSKSIPASKLIRFGVFEDGEFKGVIIFSRGASPFLGSSLGLDQTEVCELTRIALTTHKTPVSQLVAESLRELKQGNPGLRCIISFADPKEGHKGGIYQAGNWLFTGASNSVVEYFINGRWMHTRNAYHLPERPFAPSRVSPGKFRYVYPLDKQLRRKVAKLALPYPNAVEGLEVSHGDSVSEVLVQSQPTAPTSLADKPLQGIGKSKKIFKFAKEA
jgi:hypothetical protein